MLSKDGRAVILRVDNEDGLEVFLIETNDPDIDIIKVYCDWDDNGDAVPTEITWVDADRLDPMTDMQAHAHGISRKESALFLHPYTPPTPVEQSYQSTHVLRVWGEDLERPLFTFFGEEQACLDRLLRYVIDSWRRIELMPIRITDARWMIEVYFKASELETYEIKVND